MPRRCGWERGLRRALGGALALGALACGTEGGSPAPATRPVRADDAPVAYAAAAACEARDSVPVPPPPDTVAAAALALAVNIPAYRLDVREGDSLVATYPVAIGLPAHPTPEGEFAITAVEWNPWWNPPRSEWARDARRTPPGPGNPLGPVKMEFAPLYLLHGTSVPASIGTAASHGCIRLPSDAARAVAERVQRYGAADSVVSALATVEQRGAKTHIVRLDRAVPLVIRYELIEVMGDSVRAYPDVYRLRDPALDSTAAAVVGRAAGLDRAAALGLVDSVLALAADSAVSLPLVRVARRSRSENGE